MKKAVFKLLRMLGIPALVRALMQRNKVTIVLFHDPEPSHIRRLFKELRSRYNIIGLRDYVEARKSGDLRKLPRKPLIVTFDDGLKRNFELREALAELGAVATIFLSSAIVGTNRHFWFKHSIGQWSVQRLKELSEAERSKILDEFGFTKTKDFDERQALTKDEIESFKSLVDFQSHTRFHVLLPQCDDESAADEIAGSKLELERDFGLDIYSLSYPNGDYSDRDIELVKSAGYECGITVDPGFNDAATDVFRLKRICINDDADVDEMLVKACGLWAWGKKLAGKQSWGHKRAYQAGGKQSG